MNVDKTAPTLTGAADDRSRTAAGWYNGDVTVQWTCRRRALRPRRPRPADGDRQRRHRTDRRHDGPRPGRQRDVDDQRAVKIDRTAPSIDGRRTSPTGEQASVKFTAGDNLSGRRGDALPARRRCRHAAPAHHRRRGRAHARGLERRRRGQRRGAAEPRRWDRQDRTRHQPHPGAGRQRPRLEQQRRDRHLHLHRHRLGHRSLHRPGHRAARAQARRCSGTATDKAGNTAGDETTVNLDKTSRPSTGSALGRRQRQRVVQHRRHRELHLRRPGRAVRRPVLPRAADPGRRPEPERRRHRHRRGRQRQRPHHRGRDQRRQDRPDADRRADHGSERQRLVQGDVTVDWTGGRRASGSTASRRPNSAITGEGDEPCRPAPGRRQGRQRPAATVEDSQDRPARTDHAGHRRRAGRTPTSR